MGGGMIVVRCPEDDKVVGYVTQGGTNEPMVFEPARGLAWWGDNVLAPSDTEQGQPLEGFTRIRVRHCDTGAFTLATVGYRGVERWSA